MSHTRTARFALLIAGVLGIAFFAPQDVRSQRGGPPKGKADDLLKSAPKPKRPDLPPSRLPLEFIQGERVALVGNGTAERMSLYGHFETLLHSRFPDKELAVRIFARPADEVAVRQRPSDYTRLDDPLAAFGPDTFLCFFGFNESFKGPDGVKKFQADYEKFLDQFTKDYPRDETNAKARFVLVSPTAFEATGNKFLPDAAGVNANLKLYATAVAEVAKKRNLAFVDLFAPTEKAFAEQPGAQFTDNGVHVNEAGDKVVGGLLDTALFSGPNPGASDTERFEKLRAAVVDKAWIHRQDYRMLNGWYVYGGRRTWDTETFPREFLKIRAMAAVRDRYVWDIARGKKVAAKPDDSGTGDLHVPPTRFGQVPKSEATGEGPRILPPDDLIKTLTVPPGFEVKLFADESRFPEIAKPCQLNFDDKGRLWMSTMPTYPQWKPGDPRPDDKLVILEDTDGDGKADKSTVFYDKLHCPTGFEFFDGGVIVTDQPRLLFLKDTNGDDKADLVIPLIDGWATEDTHHTINAFEFSPGGLLHMLEGVSMSTAVETPWGPFRNFGSSGCYVLDPRTLKLRHFVTPGYGNPWCYVFDEWGHGFCGDGTGANQHWDTPLSGKPYPGRKGLDPVFNTETMRPVVGSDFLTTRQFPDDVQGQFVYACVINMNGIPRWTFRDDGAGFRGTRVRHDPKDVKTAFDLVKSTDKHFRPVDPMIGPDGALWFGDWANPLIGHMQYSQRDPNRDHVHGRIYRLVYKDKPLVKPVTQHGKSVAAVLDQFREYEPRTRYRARAALRGRPAAEVLPAVKAWASRLDPSDRDYDRLRCEALWVQQGFHEVDPALLKAVLGAKTPDARAAAVRVVADERELIPDARELLTAAALDDHPRVRCEAVRGLSFDLTPEGAKAVLAAFAKDPKDYWIRYTVDATLGANPGAWLAAYQTGTFAKDDAVAKPILDNILSSAKRGEHVSPYLDVLIGKGSHSQEAKNKAMQALAVMGGGNRQNGKEVFRRTCLACHKFNNEGADYGPDMTKVAGRLTDFKIVESIIDPNADIHPDYLSTKIETEDDQVVTGLLVKQNKPDEVHLFDGQKVRVFKKGDIVKQTALKQSSMPEGLAGTMAPVEFLDIVTFLKSLK